MTPRKKDATGWLSEAPKLRGPKEPSQQPCTGVPRIWSRRAGVIKGNEIILSDMSLTLRKWSFLRSVLGVLKYQRSRADSPDLPSYFGFAASNWEVLG